MLFRSAASLTSHNLSGRGPQVIDSLVFCGYSDWFLPSKDELWEMLQVLHVSNLGGFAGDTYASSSEVNQFNIYAVAFGSRTLYDNWYKVYGVGTQQDPSVSLFRPVHRF